MTIPGIPFLKTVDRFLANSNRSSISVNRPLAINMSSKTAVVSKRSATTTATVGPTKKSSTTAKKDDSTGPCKLCAQDTILAAPSVKRKNDPSTVLPQSTSGTHDGRKIGENKLLSKTNKTTRYAPF
jgi:hypothetical protein